MKTETIWLIAAGLVVACGVIWLRARPGARSLVGAPPPVIPGTVGITTPTYETRTGAGHF